MWTNKVIISSSRVMARIALARSGLDLLRSCIITCFLPTGLALQAVFNIVIPWGFAWFASVGSRGLPGSPHLFAPRLSVFPYVVLGIDAFFLLKTAHNIIPSLRDCKPSSKICTLPIFQACVFRLDTFLEHGIEIQDQALYCRSQSLYYLLVS